MGFCHGKWLRRNSDVLGHSSGYWDWVAVFTHSFQVQFYRATDQLGSFHERGPSSHAPRQVGHVGAVASRCFFVDDRVLHRLSPACSRILRSVFGAVSADGCPAIVTFPGLLACLYWRWLPVCFTIRQPSASITFMTSLIFME